MVLHAVSGLLLLMIMVAIAHPVSAQQGVMRPAPPPVHGAVVTGEIWLSGDLRGTRAVAGTVVAALHDDLDVVLTQTGIRPDGTYVLHGLPEGERVVLYACVRGQAATGLGKRRVRVASSARSDRPQSVNIQVPVRLAGPQRRDTSDPAAGGSVLGVLPLLQRMSDGVSKILARGQTGSTLPLAVRDCTGSH